MNKPVHTIIAQVPCLRVEPIGPSIGTIILYHGWSSTIQDYTFFASTVAGWGYTTVVPELPLHGERGTLDYFNPTVLQQNFWSVVLQGAEDAARIATELTQDGNRVGIMGNSCGGFIASGAWTKQPLISTAVIKNASCAWSKFEELYRAMHGAPPMSEEEMSIFQAHDPLSKIQFEPNRAVLILHGKEDTTIPIQSQRYFMEQHVHIPTDQLQMVEYSGVNHHITLGMLERAKAWFDLHLAQVQ
ncbi:prolyl oligopeptidase family serine peptidase [Paenibacillus sp. N1-5-1-14]|uniref:alpha/beta hydrolase family protein n=1 Tax=Paenibacillus radicibacter TaxID=2972488 RepID=UPI002159A351|nr:prolyl oligopeptidase family serine peptidase [Paenibacillus radicibacter]MCR8643788.1 prolyl oligopeptidase family serine peptidase [Paenibacillus radicibacter]